MKVLLVDDHHLIREGMRPVLEKLAADDAQAVAEVFEAATFEKAIDTIERHPDLDLVLLDLRLPGVTHFDALDRLRSRYPALPVVLMSGDEEQDLVRGALERGALGYIPKSSSVEVVLHALRLVLSGGTYVPPQAIGRATSTVAAHSAADIGPRLGITPRQADVLALLLAGKSNKVISRELHLAESTVKNHVAAVFKALDVTTRVQAVLAASKLGVKT